jgi:hypothetical protein
MTKAEIKLLKEFLQIRRIDGTCLLDTVVEVIKEERIEILLEEGQTRMAILEKYLKSSKNDDAKGFFVCLTLWAKRREGLEFWFNLHHHWLFVLTHINSIK